VPIDVTASREDGAVNRDEALELLRGGPPGIREWNRLLLSGETTPNLADADLGGLDLEGVQLSGASLGDARLGDANLTLAGLVGTDLAGAGLRRANLDGADLTGALLAGADLREANLVGARLTGADLRGAALYGAHLGRTTLANLDLSEAHGLDSVRHYAPSTLGTDTLLLSGGKIPEAFLRGCGLPDAWIINLPALIGALEPVQFFSCFISYSTADEEFATRLHNDFQAAGIRCWKWDHDARTGKSLWGEIDQAIRVHDKLVLIASESSLKSPAVNREIERAIRQEDERTVLKGQGKFAGDIDVLFPVRLDDFVFKGWQHERKVDVTKKVIADARGWESDAKVYARVRDRLIRDLKAEGTKAK
jgi:hypothetical protein